MFDFIKSKNKKKEKNIDSNVVSLGANAGNLFRGSEAAREHVKAYSGYNPESLTGKNNQVSLSKIRYSWKTDVEAQKGYAAEVVDVAKRNAENIMDGNDLRYSRVDDLPGHGVNETPFDIMGIAPDGTELPMLGAQMKFNNNPDDLLKNLLGKEFREKYPHAQYCVPSDTKGYIEDAIEGKIEDLKNELDAVKNSGKTEVISELNEKIKYLKKAKKNLVESKVSLNEAKTAVINPEKVTLHNMAELGHETGVKYAQTAMTITGVITFARCVDKTIKGEMSPSDAAKVMVYETAKSGGIGYLTGQANTMLASLMSNSSKEAIKKLGASSAPAQLIAFSTSVFKIINDRNNGNISDEQCFHEIAKSGLGVSGTLKAGLVGEKIGESMGFALGGPVGAIAASLIAGVIINSTYDYAVNTLKSSGIAKKERLEIEAYCEVLNKELNNYQNEFRNTYAKYTNELTLVFGDSLKILATAIKMNDAESFVLGANSITQALGGTTQFSNFQEFENFMDSNEVFEL